MLTSPSMTKVPEVGGCARLCACGSAPFRAALFVLLYITGFETFFLKKEKKKKVFGFPLNYFASPSVANEGLKHCIVILLGIKKWLTFLTLFCCCYY